MRIRLPRDDRHWRTLLVGLYILLWASVGLILGIWVASTF